MRLRRVSIHGFKTFARRSEVFFEPGVTAIVGPNGSGKSNLVDAIRWALGETNARELRGARMDEVIYAGGQTRASMSVATVELVIDNEEGRLPLDYTEVSISRRVTRGGDSEYRLNGNRIRLRDMERMLSATGLTQNGYAVVVQHDVDAIIEATPQQRRSLVEEAAGVRGLRVAREDALNRVAAVETRLLRLTDLLSDAEPRLRDLEAQAAVALEQEQVARRLAELRGSLAREEWRAARAVARRARHRLAAAQTRAEAAMEAEAGFAARLDEERGRLLAAREAQVAAAERLEAARVAAERATGDERRFAERMEASGLQRAVASAELAAADVDRVRLAREVDELQVSGAAAEAALETLKARLAQVRERHASAESEVRAGDQRLAAAEARIAAAEKAHAAAESALRDHSGRVQLLEETAGALAADISATRERATALASDALTAGGGAEVARGRLAALLDRVPPERRAVEDAREATSRARAEEALAGAAAAEASARVAAIRGQIEGALGGGPIADAVARGELTGRRLVELITVVDNADGPAIEAALEEHLSAWVVDHLDAAAALFRSMAREEALAASMSEPSTSLPPPGVRAALDAVTAEESARGALAHCLDKVWLAPEAGTARAAVGLCGGSAILPDGTRVTAAGVRGGGRPGTAVALTAARRDAEAAAAGATARQAESSARAADAQQAVDAAEAQLAELLAQTESLRAEVAEAEALARSAAAAAEREASRLDTLIAELDGRTRAVAEARIVAEAAATELAQAADELTGALTAAGDERRALGGVRVALEAAEQAVRAEELDAARAEPEARSIQRRLAAARDALGLAEQRCRSAELRLAVAEEIGVAALVRRGQSAANLVAAGREVAEASLTAEEAAQPTAGAESLVMALETQRAEVAVAAARAADEFAAAQAELAAAEGRVAELAEAVREDELDEGPEPDAAAAEKAEREIVRLERRIEALGPVNALAPQQHAVLDERVRSLRRDHDDLSIACLDIRHLAARLSMEIQRRFDAVFGAVAYHFRMLFEELFPGGRATLRMVEPPAPVVEPGAEGGEDDEETASKAAPPGVEILAQPPGKRLQSLSLLSGGERALTALAFILALQHVNPSPFYLFDEVDAPLDDANIGRFVRLMRRLSTKQQFVIVTHNHATMAAADALWGVTMEGDGQSRLLSVRLVDGEPVPQPREAVAAAY